jgi:hypothetical protein
LYYFFSGFLSNKLLFSNRNFIEKLALLVILLIPVVGVFVYFFLGSEVPPQSQDLMDNGPRGAYTNRMIAFKARKNKESQ